MKRLYVMALLGMMIFSVAGCGKEKQVADVSAEAEPETEEYAEFDWPTSEIAKLLPVPKSNIGRIEWEASDGFVIYVSETSKEDWKTYVEDCKGKGFTVDYYASDNTFYADNSDGYHLSVDYEGDDVMWIRIDEPEEDTKTDDTSADTSVDASTEKETEETEAADAPSQEPDESVSDDDIRPEFKEAMDSYEAFFNEYCDFMEKYNASDDQTSMLAEYADYMAKYADMLDKMDDIGDDDLTTAEAAYYAEVSARVMQKLSDVSQ